VRSSGVNGNKNLLLKLYQHLYAEYAEMKDGGMNDMVEEALVLDIDVIEYEHRKQIEKIIHELTKEKDSIISEKDNIISEKDNVISEKDRIISAYRLLAKNTPVESIIKETGLSREAIESL